MAAKEKAKIQKVAEEVSRSEAIFPQGGSWTPAHFFQAATFLLAFSMPLITRGLIIPLGLWIAAWLFVPKANWAEVWKPIVIFSGIYLFHLLGMGYTDNLSRGWGDLEQKLSLLIMPFILGTVRPDVLKIRKGVLAGFGLGTFLAVLISFVGSWIQYGESGLIEEFYTTRFSHLHHPSYLAFYINLSLAAGFLFLLNKPPTRQWHGAIWASMTVLCAGIVFAASKMGFIQFGFLVFLMGWVAFKKRQLRSPASMLLLFCAGLFAALLVFNPVANKRLTTVVEVVANSEKAAEASEEETTVARLHTWKLTLGLIAKHPFGVGTGDSHDALVERYREEGLHSLAEKGLNPHNNYLQIALALGLPALMWFLFSLVYPARMIFQSADWIYGFFLLGMCMHMTVESMLEKQSGVVFFAFFNALFFFSLAGKARSTQIVKPLSS